MRINKFIASNTKFSRRKVDQLIKDGQIFINGKKTNKLGTIIDPEKDIVKIGTKIIQPKTEKIYLALNKPKDFITTRSDEKNRKTVMSLIPKIENLKPVGRLDKDTEGLLLFSNDGEFINKHTHPKFQSKKQYLVKIKGELKDSEKNKLEKGIILEGKKTAKAKIIILKKSKHQTVLKITIHEGRNRQIRKMFASLTHPVKYLLRTKIGKINLGSLKKGAYRKLTKKEIYDY